MKFLLVIFALSLAVAAVFAHPQQYFLGQIPSARGFNFGIASQSSVRDPRQNRGPVLFPPSPPDADDTTSGVIVGASGYGFVPPQQSQVYYLTTLNEPAPTYTAYDYFRSPFEHRFNFI